MDMRFLMQQAKKMQKELENKENLFNKKEFIHQTNGGAITINMFGNFQLAKIDIDQDLLDDKEMLEDLVKITFNEIITIISKEKQKNAPKQMGGLF